MFSVQQFRVAEPCRDRQTDTYRRVVSTCLGEKETVSDIHASFRLFTSANFLINICVL